MLSTCSVIGNAFNKDVTMCDERQVDIHSYLFAYTEMHIKLIVLMAITSLSRPSYQLGEDYTQISINQE